MKKASKKPTKASSPKPASDRAKEKTPSVPPAKVKPGKKGTASTKLHGEIVQKLLVLGKKQGFVTIEQMKKQYEAWFDDVAARWAAKAP